MNDLHNCVIYINLQSATEGQLIHMFVKGGHQLPVKRQNGRDLWPDSDRWMLEVSLLVMQSRR